MTAASLGRDGSRYGTSPVVSYLTLAVAAAAICYQGTLAMVPLTGTDAGYVKPTAASTVPVRVVGVFTRDVNNGAGAAGALSAEVATGLFDFVNSSSVDAFAATDVPGTPVFAVDDQTVSRTAGSTGARPYVGRFVRMEGSKVVVEVGAPGPDAFGNVDLVLLAGGDLTGSQYLFVKLSAANTVVAQDSAGGDCVGVLLNAPASGAAAIVRVAGVAPVTASGSISAGVRVASTAAGKTKASQVTRCDASGASATAALTGSFVMGIALTAGTADAQHRVLLQPMGAIPGTAA